MSNLTTEGCSGDKYTLKIKEEEGELSDGNSKNDGLFIFSATFF